MTLELLPLSGGAARIGTNSIPKTLTDGLNRSNFDFNKLAEPLYGATLRSFHIKKDIRGEESYSVYEGSQNAGRPYITDRSEYVYQLAFDNPKKVVITYRYGCWFDVKASGLGYPDCITYRDVVGARKNVNQIPIVQGLSGGGDFLISAFSSKGPVKDRYRNESISIDELWLFDFLSVFLADHIDKSIQKREEWECEGFEQYGENYYTFESIRRMLNDIRAAAELLETDYDNPSLDEIKSRFSIVAFADRDVNIYEMSKEEEKEYIKKHKDVAIDFYERFIDRMENMLSVSADCDMVTFSGP